MEKMALLTKKHFDTYKKLEPREKEKESENTLVINKLFPEDEKKKKEKKSNNFLFNKLTLDW